MRAALFAPVTANEKERIGQLAEAAIFAQWQHSPTFRNLRYARWRNEGEVDIVYLSGPSFKPGWVGEIKWSDRISTSFGEQTRGIATLLKRHATVRDAFFTTKTVARTTEMEGRPLRIVPTSVYRYTVGRNVTSRFDVLAVLSKMNLRRGTEEEPELQLDVDREDD